LIKLLVRKCLMMGNCNHLNTLKAINNFAPKSADSKAYLLLIATCATLMAHHKQDV
jgi:hypothetical protein